MTKKFSLLCIFIFVFSLVFRGFSSLETGSGSIHVPSIKFKEWQIGRHETKQTDPNNKEHLSLRVLTN